MTNPSGKLTALLQTSASASTSTSVALLLLRLVPSFLLLYGHGWGKLVRFGAMASEFSDPLGIGSAASLVLVVFAEVFCAIFVMLGLGTRVFVVPILTFFLVAAFLQHAADPWPRKEFPLVFAVPFLALLLTGAGRYSLDALLLDKWSKRSSGVTSPAGKLPHS